MVIGRTSPAGASRNQNQWRFGYRSGAQARSARCGTGRSRQLSGSRLFRPSVHLLAARHMADSQRLELHLPRSVFISIPWHPFMTCVHVNRSQPKPMRDRRETSRAEARRRRKLAASDLTNKVRAVHEQVDRTINKNSHEFLPTKHSGFFFIRRVFARYHDTSSTPGNDQHDFLAATLNRPRTVSTRFRSSLLLPGLSYFPCCQIRRPSNSWKRPTRDLFWK